MLCTWMRSIFLMGEGGRKSADGWEKRKDDGRRTRKVRVGFCAGFCGGCGRKKEALWYAGPKQYLLGPWFNGNQWFGLYDAFFSLYGHWLLVKEMLCIEPFPHPKLKSFIYFYLVVFYVSVLSSFSCYLFFSNIFLFLFSLFPVYFFHSPMIPISFHFLLLELRELRKGRIFLFIHIFLVPYFVLHFFSFL